jgi:hypothetical protein
LTEQTLTGSCLCGALKYRVDGEPTRFYHCHCSRCRKSSGTGHATNLFVEKGTLEWSGDVGLNSRYKLPQAQRFTRTFCATCGGPLPRDVPEAGFVFVPAGTLDEEPNIKPQARIFLDSKTSWSCGAEEIPGFSDYPK